MNVLKKIFKILGYTLLVLVILLLAGFTYLVVVAKEPNPKISDAKVETLQRMEKEGLYYIDNNWFRKSKSGLYEMYVEGEPFERGVVNGKLSKELIQRQEDVFVSQIKKMIPSTFYLHFLKYFIGWFNRDLAKNVKEEYKEEIYGESLAASTEYDYIGTNYQRILNYHAAHDIGHALQSMALVGCTSFGTWGSASADSTMIIGRNFDFYMGDQFAEDKIVSFTNPSQGHKFMTVTWGGFIGAVSGMNDQGLTVTINADKTAIPAGSATPVSLVAREILQYAKNIQEAYTIAAKRKMFVSEAFLVGSALDNKAVIIEKTPEQLAMYDPKKNYILCANHFQSDLLGQTKENKEQKEKSASVYRYERLTELMQNNGPNTVQKTINILRDQKGLHGANIGMGNEKAVNQLIAHHSIVFEPQKRLVWVSSSPWQLGQFVCYDLNKVFAMHGMKDNHEIVDSALTVPADSFITTSAYKDFVLYRSYKQRVADKESINVDSLITSNPEYYHTYVIAGDYLFKQKNFAKAKEEYTIALTKVIATKQEEEHIRRQIAKCEEELAHR
ncbi:C45 family autoproteolytic acyltransferase/hydolase [Pinibacter soli]|uniref:C45 family autoproteolytic acyltransferase/hydrolase n=1 Tax=Pinibacter soli TaxID=3044211 RepID=A0ABT6R7T8_9BACT|nr:C45 family peptidase [Pinibacter soli]MDI3318471.1 C45 family autoproteolytic acyltransferase/hydrolase [Pinibacter soli]